MLKKGIDGMTPDEQLGFMMEAHEYITVHETTGAVVELLMNGGIHVTLSWLTVIDTILVIKGDVGLSESVVTTILEESLVRPTAFVKLTLME